MKRIMRAAAAAAILTSGAGTIGCAHTSGGSDCANGDAAGAGRKTCGDCYRNWVDPSWPERYNSVARKEVVAPFAAQVNNGHVLNQTVWNWYFEPGTDKLNEAGVQKLDSIARTRPSPDTRLYIQTARDLPVTAETIGTVSAQREELNAKRAAVIQKYMAAQPAGATVAYEVFVHDPVVPGIEAQFAGAAYRGMTVGYRGGLTGAAGQSTLGTGIAPLTTVNVTNPGPQAGQGGGQGGGSGGTTTTTPN